MQAPRSSPSGLTSLPDMLRRTPAPRPLTALLSEAAADYPERPHLTFKGTSWNYAQTLEIARRLSTGLLQIGVREGDRVGICLPNTPHYPVACFALWAIGAAGVGMNPIYSARQLELIIRDSGARFVLTSDDATLSKLREVASTTGIELILCRSDASDLEPRRDNEVCESGLTFERLASREEMAWLRNSPKELGMIQYTGGTTGAPKGAMLTQAQIWHAAHQIRNWQHRIRDGLEAWYAAAPCSHITGLINYIVMPAIVGGEVILTERFSPRELIELVRAKWATMITAIPTMLTAVIAEPDAGDVDWSGVRHVLVGGAPVPAELARRFTAVTGLRPQQGYAMTETAGSGVAMPFAPLQDHPEATGVPMPEVRVEIRRLDDPSQPVPAGEIGEVCFAGPNVIESYWARPLGEAERTPDGLLRSGDMGRLTEDGLLYVVDRLKDVIICSGYNVYPRTVEDAVLEHPAVAETVAVGVADSYRGETVLSVVALKQGAELSLGELQSFLRERLSPIEIPKRLEIVETLPKTENAKLSRQAVRQLIAERMADVRS